MPEHFYNGHGPGCYPMGGDNSGLLLGAVEPGDVRDLDEPPDPSWLPRDGNEEQLAVLLAGRGETAVADVPQDEGAPALPRRKRAASTSTGVTPDTTTAGTAGSEEN